MLNNAAQRASNNPEMEGPMCCMCIPMRYGVVLIGIYVLIDVAQTMGQANALHDTSKIVFGFYAAALLPAIIAVYIYLRYFLMSDSLNNREHLQLACGLMVVSTVTQYAGICTGAIFDGDNVPTESIWIFLILHGFNTFNYIYFYIMTSIWAQMHPEYQGPLLMGGGNGMEMYGGNNTAYMTGGPIGGSHYPSENDVRRDLRSMPPPNAARQKQQAAFNNPKSKAKTLDQLAKEAERENKKKGLK